MIAENVKYFCKREKITLAQLADRLQITRQTLHSLITKPATVTSIEKIAAALQVESWKILHPDPASLEEKPTTQPGPAALEGNTAPVLFCPICGSRLNLALIPAELETASDERTQADNTTPAPRPDGCTQAPGALLPDPDPETDTDNRPRLEEKHDPSIQENTLF